MKIYKSEKKTLIRVSIRKNGEETKYLNFEGVGLDECKEHVKQTINPYLKHGDLFEKVRTAIDFREAIGGKNLKSTSCSFVGLSTQDVYDILIENYS